MNFAKGILESRVQTYKHLKHILKTIPLETPTTIELSPGNELRITLFDANHCIGAVMFLIQGKNGKAILYSGDIRAETWWVNSLVRNPLLLPYTLGIKRLDCLYLDTTFATRAEPYRDFASKAQGLRELLHKVSTYPKDALIYIQAWTFGYEDVWIALAAHLHSQVHLDPYRWRLYNSLRMSSHALRANEAAALCGFELGNHHQRGCLTANPSVRLHSCERGNACPRIDDNRDVVRILPIVTRLRDGTEIGEIGAGGGKGDLDQVHELEATDAAAIGNLMQLCATELKDPEKLLEVLAYLSKALSSDTGKLTLDAEDLVGELSNNIPLTDFVELLSKITRRPMPMQSPPHPGHRIVKTGENALPRTITFPYSRHSSYSELCELVAAFRPCDVFPCTVDEQTWTPEVSMRSLFGQLCSGDVFRHDREMTAKYDDRQTREAQQSVSRKRPSRTASPEEMGSPESSRSARKPRPNDKPGTSHGGDACLSDESGHSNHLALSAAEKDQQTRNSHILDNREPAAPPVQPNSMDSRLPSTYGTRSADIVSLSPTAPPVEPHSSNTHFVHQVDDERISSSAIDSDPHTVSPFLADRPPLSTAPTKNVRQARPALPPPISSAPARLQQQRASTSRTNIETHRFRREAEDAAQAFDTNDWFELEALVCSARHYGKADGHIWRREPSAEL